MDSYTGQYVLKSLENYKTLLENLNDEDNCPKRKEELKSMQKCIYDHINKNNSLTELKPKSFRKLLINGFDSEQIFQQIDLQNRSAIVHFERYIDSISDSKFVQSQTGFEHSDDGIENSDVSDDEDNLNQDYPESEMSSRRKGEYVFDDDSDDMSDSDVIKPKFGSQDEINFVDDSDGDIDNRNLSNNVRLEEDSLEEESDHIKEKSSNSKKVSFQDQKQKSKYKSVVDDQFFKLSKLEEFLKIEDLREENKLDKSDDEESSDDEEDIDYFQDIPLDIDLEDSADESKNENVKKSSSEIWYKDFFDAPESSDENIDEAAEPESNDTDNENDIEDNEDDEEDDKIEENQQKSSEDKKTAKTPFEIQQEKTKLMILSYEESIIERPDWTLTGEVAASSRPVNSLMKQETQFDVKAPQVHIEDDELDKKTEKNILSIVRNKAFSDGQRTYKPLNDLPSKKEIILDQAKSKKSLAEVYADDYLKKKYGEQEEENPKHVEIKKMMDDLMPHLQALFSHIPKPAIPDIKIVSNLPAITVEDVAPTSISDATLLAPEEVKRKSGLIKGKTERTDSDRKRERRKKKIFQKMKYSKLEKEASENPNSAKAKKLEKINTLKRLKQHRNTKIAELSGEKIKSSKDFFSRLHETVNSQTSVSKKKKK